MNSIAHKWIIENFSLFHKENVNHNFSLSKNVSKFDSKTNTFSHNNRNNPKESNKTLNHHRFIYSPNFGSKINNEKCNIYLELCPAGFDEDSKDFLSIFINLRSFRDCELDVKYKVSILDQNQQPIDPKEDKGNLEKSARFGWKHFIWLENLKSKFLINDTLTIYCEIHLSNKLSPMYLPVQNLNPNVPKASYFNAKTQKTTKLFAHQWTIENFNSIFFNSNSKHLINSQQFPNASNDVQFNLCLYPRGLNEEMEEYLLICFNSNSKILNQNEIAYFRVSLLDSLTMNRICCRGAPIKITNSDPNRKTWGWHLMKREELLEAENKYVFQNKLTIYCEVWLLENGLKSLPGQSLNLRPRISQTSPKPITQNIVPNSVFPNTKSLLQQQFRQESTQKSQQQPNLTRTKPLSQSQVQLDQINSQKNSIAFANQKIQRHALNDKGSNPKNLNKPKGFVTDMSKYELKPIEAKGIASSSKSLSTLSLNSNQSNSKRKVEKKNIPKENSKQENKSDAEQKQKSSKTFENININATNSIISLDSKTQTGDVKIKSIDKILKMASKNQSDNKANKISANTNVSVPKNVTKKLSGQHMWPITDFIARCKLGDPIESGTFSPLSYSDIKFYLQLCPKGIGVGKDSHVSFRLFLHECDRKDISIKATLSIIKTENNNEEFYSREFIGKLSRGQSGDWSTYVKTDYIMSKFNGFLPNDKLTMRCKIDVFDFVITGAN